MVEEDGYERAPLGCMLGFLPYPVRLYRVFRPGDDDDRRGGEARADIGAPGFAGRQRAVPEHRPALGLEGMHELLDTFAILVCIADKDIAVGHAPRPRRIVWRCLGSCKRPR